MKKLLNIKMKRRTLVKASAAASLLGSAGALAAAPTSAAGVVPPLRPRRQHALGERHSRSDGGLKVQGQARYAIEQPLADLVYAVVVQATIAAGRVRGIDSAAAKAAPGVLAVYTPQESLPIKPASHYMKGGAAAELFTPLQDDLVRFNGQHIALVVAETFEQATEAARLLAVDYELSTPVVGIDARNATPQAIDGNTVRWGDAAGAMAAAAVKVEAVYTTPREYNTPLEPHACIAQWHGEDLTVWEPSQWVGGARQVIAEWMDIPSARVRVVSPYVGGGFGSKVSPHPHVALACAAARKLQRPVKLALTRPQTFTALGGRPATRQRLALGADASGRLVAIEQEGWNETAIDDTYVESCGAITALMYQTPNLTSRHNVIPTHTVTPSWMRAPGENPSAYALETAMDELAYKLNLDPVELRLRNWAEVDPKTRKPWTTRQSREAYAAGAAAFGWARRNPVPRSMREGRELIGWGMACGSYPVHRTPGEAKVILHASGQIEVHSSGADIGTGTYTILAQTAADVFAVDVTRVKVLLGDTQLPRAPFAGGSQLANLLTGAVHKTALAARSALLELAVRDPKSPFHGSKVEELAWADGEIRLVRRHGSGIDFPTLLHATSRTQLAVHGDTFKPGATEKDKHDADTSFIQTGALTDPEHSAHSWSAHFVEVRVDEDFGTIRVKRMVGAFDSGLVYNPKLAESQWIGGMVMGLGQALLEEGAVDLRDGRVVNASLADYVLAVNADVPDIQTISVGIPDYLASPMGGKAVGELGIVGVAAAIGNAVFHATGKRIRDLPITLEKLG